MHFSVSPSQMAARRCPRKPARRFALLSPSRDSSQTHATAIACCWWQSMASQPLWTPPWSQCPRTTVRLRPDGREAPCPSARARLCSAQRSMLLLVRQGVAHHLPTDSYIGCKQPTDHGVIRRHVEEVCQIAGVQGLNLPKLLSNFIQPSSFKA
jgi:hypothetical protein